MNEITVNGNYKNNEISHEEVPNINMTHNTFEERLFEVIRSQIKETLKTMLPQHLQAIRNDIKILQDSVDTLRDEFTTIHPFQTASNIVSLLLVISFQKIVVNNTKKQGGDFFTKLHNTNLAKSL